MNPFPMGTAWIQIMRAYVNTSIRDNRSTLMIR